MNDDHLLSVQEAADYLNVSEAQVRQLATRKRNPLPSFAIPSETGLKISRRFRRDELEKWLEGYREREASVVQLRETG